MKKRNCIPAIVCSSLMALTACQNESENTSFPTDLAMHVVAGIGNTTVPTGRYAGDSPNLAMFDEGDDIGIFVDNQAAVQWTYTNQTWKPARTVYWPDKENPHAFQAFYPYTTAASPAEIPMPGLKEQTGTMESVAACDFLVAQTTQAYGSNGVVVFQGEGKSFRHISSLVQLTIKAGGDLNGATLTALSLEGEGLVAPSHYSFADGVKYTQDETSNRLALDLNLSMGTADVTYYLVVNEKTDASTTVTLSLQYTSGGQSYTATLNGLSGNVFKGGMMQRFTLSVQNLELFVTGSTISPWVEGNELEDLIIDAKKDEV